MDSPATMPALNIPDVPLTAYVLERASQYANRPALIDGVSGRRLTYGQLAERIERAAGGLAARGFGRGDVLALACPNVPEYAIAFHAALRLGGIVTPVSPLHTTREMAAQFIDAGARWVVAAPDAADQARQAAGQVGARELFVLGEGVEPFGGVAGHPDSAPDVPIDPARDMAALPYSSGTTGMPKGVMLTHRHLVANLAQLEAVEPVTPDDVLVAVLPFFHIYGLTFVLNLGLRCGATVVTVPRFELASFLRIMQDYGVTRAALVPPIILALARHPLVEAFDLSALRVIVSGAAPLSAEVASACAERLGCIVKQGYGLTETSPVTHINPDDAVRPGTVGRPLPGITCRIVDVESGADLGPGQPGEVQVRGPQVMAGYLNNPPATAETLDGAGWLRTGDVGMVDGDGYLTIVDRLKEMIKVKGYQVAPAELEAVLLTHPAVADAAVVPSPDAAAGEVPKAFIVQRGDVTASEIMGYVAGQVAAYKRVRRVAFVEAIPRSASGKVLRRVLVEQERGSS